MEDFWEDIHELARSQTRAALEVGRLLDLYLDMVTVNLNDLDDRERSQCARLLLGSPLFNSHAGYSRRRLVNLLEIDHTKEVAFYEFLGMVLLADCVSKNHIPVEFQNSPVVQRSIDVLWLYRYTEPRLVSVYLDLVYRLGAEYAWEDEALAAASPALVCYLLCIIRDQQEQFQLAIKALAAMSNQFLLAGPVQNTVLQIMESRAHEFREVGHSMVWSFNRSTSTGERLLLARLFDLLFVCDQTRELFYLNDLKVLLDVLLRELLDLPRDAASLRVTYLQMLCPLLENTTLRQEGYKRSAIVMVLRSMLESSDEAVRKLSGKCLSTDWLAWQHKHGTVDAEGEQDHLSAKGPNGANGILRTSSRGNSPLSLSFRSDSPFGDRSPVHSPTFDWEASESDDADYGHYGQSPLPSPQHFTKDPVTLGVRCRPIPPTPRSTTPVNIARRRPAPPPPRRVHAGPRA